MSGDLRSSAAAVAGSRGIFAEQSLKVDIFHFDGIATLEEALKNNELNAAYIDARQALVLAATGAVNMKMLAIANRSEHKPQTLLAVMAPWAADNQKACDGLLEAHRQATALLQRGDPEAIAIAADWAGVNTADLEAALPRLHLEGGVDRAALIDMLDDLRTAGDITPQQADNLARKLVREHGQSAGKP